MNKTVRIPQRPLVKFNPYQGQVPQKMGSVAPSKNQLSNKRDWSRTSAQEMADIRAYVDDQKKCAGQVLATQANTQVSFTLNIPSVGKLLLGFGFVSVIPAGPVSLTINNVVIVQGVDGRFFNVANLEKEYYEYFYPLAGVDKLVLTITDGGAQQCPFSFYYL